MPVKWRNETKESRHPKQKSAQRRKMIVANYWAAILKDRGHDDQDITSHRTRLAFMMLEAYRASATWHPNPFFPLRLYAIMPCNDNPPYCTLNLDHGSLQIQQLIISFLFIPVTLPSLVLSYSTPTTPRSRLGSILGVRMAC